MLVKVYLHIITFKNALVKFKFILYSGWELNYPLYVVLKEPMENYTPLIQFHYLKSCYK